MTICENCIHKEVCGIEGYYDEALKFCADKIEERPKGEWIISQTMDCHSDIVNIYTCPFCGEKEFSAYPYCHCGADMRKGAAE